MSKPEKAATAFLEEHQISTLPIPVEQLAREAGLDIVYEPFNGGGVSGMLFKDGNRRPAIVVNSAESPVRQRFTVAHELGHFFLRHRQKLYVNANVSVSFRDSESGLATKREEMEANQFAAALLMPRAFVDLEANQALRQVPELSNDELASRLAGVFDVSALAMGYRLLNLGHIGAV